MFFLLASWKSNRFRAFQAHLQPCMQVLGIWSSPTQLHQTSHGKGCSSTPTHTLYQKMSKATLHTQAPQATLKHPWRAKVEIDATNPWFKARLAIFQYPLFFCILCWCFLVFCSISSLDICLLYLCGQWIFALSGWKESSEYWTCESTIEDRRGYTIIFNTPFTYDTY